MARIEGVTDATTVDTTATFSAAGTYVLRLAADDGQLAGSDYVAIVVEPPNQPPVDVPVAELPIQVKRTYDSRDKGKGDFGIGWRLEMSNVRLAEKGVVSQAFEGVRHEGFFLTYCLQAIQPQVVTVTLTDGTVHE